MNSKEILRFCLEKGILIDQEILELFSETSDLDSVKFLIEKIGHHTSQKIITKTVFDKNKEQLNQFFSGLPQENQKSLEKLKIKLGLSIEISKEISVEEKGIGCESFSMVTPHHLDNVVKIDSMGSLNNKKFNVSDFVNYFRQRFFEAKNILQEHSELTNLVSINKIFGNRQGISVIGIVSGKSVTKNKNIILDIEDLTGRIKVLIRPNNVKLYEKVEQISLDSIIGVKGSGNREILFINEIVLPEPILKEKKKSNMEEYVLFIGDLHFGSKKFLKENFLKFIDYLNGDFPNTPEVDKIKYLFIVGDLVAGVGVYPGQEEELEIEDLEEQFEGVAKLLGKIRKDIKIIISPGNHDGVRLMEPQPLFDKKYAWPLYDLENIFLTENPCRVNIASRKDFPGFNILTYHGFSFPYYAKNIPSLIKQKAINKPELIIKYLLENRHLAPTHTSVQYFPLQEDIHFIKEIPDIFVAGHLHKSGVCYYKNILLVSVSCWESLTSNQKKLGILPDFCKVPMFNLKTRAIKVLDFE